MANINMSKERKSASGTIRIHPRGFGFLLPDERTRFPVDIFIPRHATLKAVDGDYVRVRIHATLSEKGPEGEVIQIIRRGRSELAGIIISFSKKGHFFAYVPLLGEQQTMRILPPEKNSLAIGDRILIKVVDWGEKSGSCSGTVSAYIGPISDPSCDLLAALKEYDLQENFPEEALQEARSYGKRVLLAKCGNRRDLRSRTCFTIDPETAKDFDDALSLTWDAHKKQFQLGVHIADVSYYVPPGSHLDRVAAQRCNSVYFPGFVVPMLPHELSSHLCSLKPQVNRLAVSVLMTLDETGALIEYEICRSLIKSQKRFTYEEARAVLESPLSAPFKEELHLMVSLCKRLKKRRAARGSIEFALPDLQLKLSQTGEVEGCFLVEYDITHQLVEEFMLLANEVVATHLSQQQKPLTYRIHEEPNPENLREFMKLAAALGFSTGSATGQDPTSEQLQQLFDEARQTPFGQFLAVAFIRSMKLAHYSTQNIGHYGLGLAHYTHFTSPIRRYIDLLVHRLLFAEVDHEENLEEIALTCSEKERLSAKAEQSVVLLKKLRYLEKRRQEGEILYTAVVVARKPFGLVFELKELLYEGFLPLPKSDYQIGESLSVRLVEVNLISRETTWRLVTSPHKSSAQPILSSLRSPLSSRQKKRKHSPASRRTQGHFKRKR